MGLFSSRGKNTSFVEICYGVVKRGEMCYREGPCCWNYERDRENSLIRRCVQNLRREVQERYQRVERRIYEFWSFSQIWRRF